jgi:hypothetical protein
MVKGGNATMTRNLHRDAESFIKGQIKIMKKHGSEPHLDSERFKRAVEGTQRTFKALSSSSGAQPLRSVR